jgi:hypothetical protein
MKLPVLGLDCTSPSSGASAPTYFEGGGLLSRAMVLLPDDEHARRHRMLERYLEKRAGYIHAGNDTIH